MGTGIFSIGVSGLTTAQLGLLATEHNVVNANTPGYSRQTTVQATNIAVNTGAGAIGQGVHVVTVKRVYDQYLTNQVNSAQTNVSELDAYYSQIAKIDNMLADSTAGLSPALQDFFSGVQQVASNPSLLPARQEMISSAETLVSRFQSIDNLIGELGEQVNSRISDTVSEINAYANQIAELNQRIVISESSFGQPANDLLDQRDEIIKSLNTLVKVSTSTNSDGSYNVFIGSGQQLVVGSRVMQMTAGPSLADPSKVVVGLKTGTGSLELPSSLITGGALGGLINFRNESLETVANEVGRVAASLVLTFNAQYALGQDLLGNSAGDPSTSASFVGNFFTLSAPTVKSNSLNTGSGVVSAGFAAPTAPSAPDFSGNFTTDLTASDYQLVFGAAGAYTINRLSDNQVVASGTGAGSVTFDGVTVTISSVGNANDSFVIKPVSDAGRNIGVNAQVAADPRLVAAAAPVRTTEAIANTGSMVLSQGIVGVGYSTAGLPVTLSAVVPTLGSGLPDLASATINGLSGTWTAIYSDGTTSTSSGNIPYRSGVATLSKISFSGMSFDITGAPTNGDQFTVERNTSGVQDGRNAVLFAKLQTQGTVAGGAATFQAAYSQMVADNGIRTREAKIQLDAQTAVLTQAEATRDSLSGVNLDEEAANMLKFQQAYQAASKILEVGNKLFDTILALG